jgi:hypothetical protein
MSALSETHDSNTCFEEREMTAATQVYTMANETKQELSKQEVGYLMLMWTLLAMNVMVMTFINTSLTHCM